MNLFAFRGPRLLPNSRDSAHRVSLGVRRRFLVIGIRISMLSSRGNVEITKVSGLQGDPAAWHSAESVETADFTT